MAALFDLNETFESDPAIAGWWQRKPPALAALAREWFTVMKACGDDVREAMHDDYPTACIGRYPFAHVGAFSAHVNVAFFYGAHLYDPHRLLIGTGRNMRHVKLKPGEPTPWDALHALIEAAYADLHRRLAALPANNGAG